MWELLNARWIWFYVNIYKKGIERLPPWKWKKKKIIKYSSRRCFGKSCRKSFSAGISFFLSFVFMTFALTTTTARESIVYTYARVHRGFGKNIWCPNYSEGSTNSNWLIETLIQWPFKSLDNVIICVHIGKGARVIISKLTYTRRGRTYLHNTRALTPFTRMNIVFPRARVCFTRENGTYLQQYVVDSDDRTRARSFA